METQVRALMKDFIRCSGNSQDHSLELNEAGRKWKKRDGDFAT
jgi:hypothetical protein